MGGPRGQKSVWATAHMAHTVPAPMAAAAAAVAAVVVVVSGSGLQIQSPHLICPDHIQKLFGTSSFKHTSVVQFKDLSSFFSET